MENLIQSMFFVAHVNTQIDFVSSVLMLNVLCFYVYGKQKLVVYEEDDYEITYVHKCNKVLLHTCVI